VQDGPRVAAVIIYLCTGQFLPGKRTAQALAELSGIPLSPGTVAGITARATQTLDEFLEQVRENITASDVAGFDETGFRVEGRLHWVHCARTGKYTLLMVHPRRGRQAMEAMGVLPSFTGIAVRDTRAPYDTCTPAGHQLCCAHALRELQAVTGSAPAGRWCWAAQAAGALTGMQALVSEATGEGREAADPAAPAAQIHRYRSAVLPGARQTAARSGTLMRNTTPWPAGCPTARMTTCGSRPTGGYQRTTTDPSATSA
jgi:transposase